MSLVEITSAPLDTQGKAKAVVLFGASWHPGCAPLEAILTALAASATTSSDVYFGKVDAEAVSDLAETYQVTAVPTLMLMNGNVVVERLEGGVEPAQVTVAIQRLLAATAAVVVVVVGESAGAGAAAATAAATAPVTTTTTRTTTADPEKALTQRLDRLVRSDAVMLFMKGVPTAPQCGFSRQAIELLQEQKVPFGSFDILSDDQVRQGLKKYGNWPTYPQLYVNGELQGGLDVLKELAEDGNLADQWGLNTTNSSSSPVSTLSGRLEELVNRNAVMIFMKGLPSAPKCGFSRQLIGLLDDSGVAYDAFDILQDDDVRQGLKDYSNWPTFPQLYVKGELVGGLDICQELHESGDWIDTLQG